MIIKLLTRCGCSQLIEVPWTVPQPEYRAVFHDPISMLGLEDPPTPRALTYRLFELQKIVNAHGTRFVLYVERTEP